MNIWWSLPFVSALALLLTGFLRNYALTRSLMDIPNVRSSHTIPTPRGGGVSIVISFFFSLVFLATIDLLVFPSLISLLGAGGLVALVGFLDDHKHIPARWRLLVHFVAANWAITWLGGLPPLLAFGVVLDLGWPGHMLAAVFLVWLLNLYNFMDGIDGIASIEAVTVCLGGVVLYGLSEENGSDWELPLVLMAAIIGFLFWNFPKARIFMGDAGSGFVGFMLGIFSIQAAWVAQELFWGWLILLGAFVVDATVTLLRRIRRGDKFYEAHRSHAYQYASRKFGAHYPVSLAFGGINLFWLLPVAALVTVGRLDGILGTAIAYAPIIWLAFHFKAGARELQEV